MLGVLQFGALFAAGTSAILYGVRGLHAPGTGFGLSTKTLSILCLLLFAALVDAPAFLLIAVFCAMLGDICLTQKGDHWVMAGMGAFGLTHLFYCFSLVQRADAVLAWPMGICISLGGAALWFLRVGAPSKLRPALAGYILVITVMLGLAFSAGGMALIAALLFTFSDFVLGTILFRPLRWLSSVQDYCVWACYWLAQVFFVAAFTL